MGLNFVIPEINIGGTDGTPTLQFYRRGFNLLGTSGTPTWQDIVLQGNGALTLVNAKANGLNYVKLYGGCEQNGTPTPDNPMDIVSNNGVVKVSPNLVEFNETRITNTTWANADKTKGFEVCADVYNKSIGDSMLSNANTFGVFVPCKQGESISLDFFNYEPMYARCFYCEITADRKCNTTPQSYASSSAITQKTFTLTQSNSIGFVFEWYINPQQTRDYTASNYMIVKGSTPPTKYMPYGQIYADGTQETVQVTGKNLFDKTDTDNIGGWYVSGGVLNVANANRTYVMRCQPSTTYYIKHCSVTGGARLFYTEVEDWDIGSACSRMEGAGGGSAGANTVYSITTSANAKWLFVNYGRSGQTATLEEQASDFILSTVELTSDTPYEPYFNGGNATAEMLLKVDDYQDVQSVLDGSVTRNVGIKVLDGTEYWIATSSANNAYLQASELPGVKTNSPVLCSHLINSSTGTPRIQLTSVLRVYGIGTEWSDKANFQQWLKDQYANGTPVIVVYPLATATTETVTAQPLMIQEGTNIIQITEASISNLPLEVSYKGTV